MAMLPATGETANGYTLALRRRDVKPRLSQEGTSNNLSTCVIPARRFSTAEGLVKPG